MRSRGARAIFTVALAVCLVLCLAGIGTAADLQLVNEFGAGQLTANVNDLEVAPSGNLVVSDGGTARIQTFTPAGVSAGTFGSSGTGPGQFATPFGVATQSDGTIFVEDSGHGRVEVFNAGGTFLRQIATPVDFYADAAFDPAQAIVYLVDYQSGNVQRVSTTGANQGLMGSKGTGDGQFQRPLGVAVDPGGNIYVADRDNNRVEKLSPSGAFLAHFGSAGSGPGQMRGPEDVAIEPSGNVLVSDTNNFRLEEFTSSGQFLASYERVAGSPTTNFVPWAIAVAPSGDIYVSDRQGASQPRILRVRAGAATPAVPPPVLGKSVDVSVVSGTVLVREKGTSKFHRLTAADSIPVGSSVDTQKGRVRLTSAKKGSGTQTADFFQGRFKVSQKGSGLTDMKLEGGNLKCSRGAQHSARRRGRRLWGRGTGSFRTTGHNGSATVRGTYWLVADRCDGTLTKVKEGSVTVRDFTRHRTVIVRAGKQYLAPAR